MVNKKLLTCLVLSLSLSPIFTYDTYAAPLNTASGRTQLDALVSTLREDYKALTKIPSGQDRSTPRQTFSKDMTELMTYVGANPSTQTKHAQTEANKLQENVEKQDVQTSFAPLKEQYNEMNKANRSQPSLERLLSVLKKAVSNKTIDAKSLEHKAAQDLWNVISARRKDIVTLKGLIPQPSNAVSTSAQKLFNQLLANYNKIIETTSDHLDKIDTGARSISEQYIAISSGNDNNLQSPLSVPPPVTISAPPPQPVA